MSTVNRTMLKFINYFDADFPVYKEMCYDANNITNSARYHIKQPHIKAFHKGHLYPFSYPKLWAEFKNEANRKQINLTQTLGGSICQQILRRVTNDFKVIVRSKYLYNQHPHLFKKKPRFPSYNKKGSYATFRLSSQLYKFDTKSQTIILKPKKITKRTPWWKAKLQNNIHLCSHNKIKNVKSILVVPKFNYIELAISYRAKVPKLQKDNGKYFSIDPGYHNLMAIASNIPGIKPLLIKDGCLMRHSYRYQRIRSHLQSNLPKQHYYSYRLGKLDSDYQRYTYNCIHQACNQVICYAVKYHISKIIVGSGASDAQNKANLGKATDQGYCRVPFGKLFKILQYKGQNYGINVLLTEESYTSQSSFLNDEEPVASNGNKMRKNRGIKHWKRRCLRGLFISYVNHIAWFVNADINGALQIMKKQLPNAFNKLNFQQKLHLCCYPKVINIKL